MNFDPEDFKTYSLKSGDLLLNEASGSPNEVGKPAIWNGEIPGCCFQNTLLRVRPEAVSPAFLYWYCRAQALAGSLGAAGRGVNIRHLGKAGLASFPMPLPPLLEQERIVAAIEEHLSRLDAAEDSLSTASRRLAALQASLIESAVGGDWPVEPLGALLNSLRNGCFVSRPAAEPPGLPIYRISAVRPLRLDADDVRYAPSNLHRASDYLVRTGDVLFTRYSGNPAYVGACAVVTESGAGRLHPDKLIRGVPNVEMVLPQWIALAASAGRGRREIESRLKTTAGQVGISGAQLRTVPLPLPPPSVQRQRIDEWVRAQEGVGRLTADVAKGKHQIHALRRSVLAAAFAGKLVPQDPDDEPASVLLERIAAERGRSPAPPRTRKVRQPG